MTIDDIKLKGFAGLSHVETKPIMKSDHDGGVQEYRRVMSNGEYLDHICRFTNPMVGPFIIKAINEFAEKEIARGDELIANEKKLKEEEDVIPLFSAELYVEVAKFIRLQNYYQYEEGK
jgi:hypothetical protein|tara:strand:+ start:185 stop:541 length:357 start_codon:yes stop_codon:yes gene_type:complete